MILYVSTSNDEGLADAGAANPFRFTQTSPRDSFDVAQRQGVEPMHRQDGRAFHCVYSSGRHTAHGRYPAATAVCSSAKNTRFLTSPPRAMARSAAGQSSLPYTRLGRWPPSAPGVV